MGLVNLHVHTEYSILDGMCKIGELVSHAKKLNQNALAITDHGFLFGVIAFYKECIKQGIKPIIGCEVYTVHDRTTKNATTRDGCHLVLLARNAQGYKNLLKIASDAATTGFYYRPKTDISVLREHSSGIIAMSACLAGEIPQLLMNGEYQAAKELALIYNGIFDEFYLEIQADDTPDQLRMNHLIIQLHDDTGIPLVVSNDTHYVFKDDAWVHEVLLAIQTAAVIEAEEDQLSEVQEEESGKGKKKGSKKSAKKRFRFPSYNYWLKDEQEIRDILPDYGRYLDEAIANTQFIADKCNVEIEFGHNMLPCFDVPDSYTADTYLSQLCYSALYDLCQTRQEINHNDYYKRLAYELQIIKDAGIAGYFLVENDFIDYAKRQNIAVGCGRGSAAGCLVSYLLNITEVDPLGYQTDVPLMFERFYLPGRKDLPDYMLRKVS